MLLMRQMPGAWLAAATALCWAAPSLPGATLDFSAAERASILAHGPWPPAPRRDATNRASGNPEAIALGKALFFDPRLARDEGGSCATCHQPQRHFADGRATAEGALPLERNTQSLLNVRLQRWFGWDGGGDSLWSQSLRPILSPREMDSTVLDTANLVAGDPVYRRLFDGAYGLAFSALDAERTFVLVGKALAAYQETLLSPRTAFDDFRDALAAGDRSATDRYPPAAQRGLRLFVGKARCSVCHTGPGFSSGGFGDVGIGNATAPDADPGRYAGIQNLLASRYNLLGEFNDDTSGASAVATAGLRPRERHRGEFRIPSLRGVSATAPFMHDGSLATLRDVVDHYSSLEGPARAGGEPITHALRLRAGEVEDLLAFLHTLGGKG